MTDILTFLRARLDELQQAATEATPGPWRYNPAKAWHLPVDLPVRRNGEEFVGAGPLDATVGVAATGPADDPQSMADAQFIALNDPAYVLADIAAKRQIVALHVPLLEIVEWPDDQTGKGEAYTCTTCRQRDIDGWINWHPAIGQAGVLPPGVTPPYIVAPCPTLRLLALPFAAHPDYRPEWTP